MNFKRNQFVQRPVARIASYKPYNVKSCMEYNLNKKEIKSLFFEADFSAKIIAMRRKFHELNKIKKNLDLIYKKFDCLKVVTPKFSFADKVKTNNITSQEAISYTPYIPTSGCLMSLEEARTDFKDAVKLYQKERNEALNLVKAIASRYPKKIYPIQKDRTNLISLSEGKAFLNKERRYLKRHPAKEVKSFPIGCFAYTPQVEYELSNNLDITIKNNVRSLGGKVNKIKRDRNSFESLKSVLNNCYKIKENIRVMDEDFENKIKFLKFKIRMIILRFRNPEYVDWLFSSKMSSYELPRPQMENEGFLQSNTLVVDKKSNVVIQEESITEKGTPHKISEQFSSLSVSKQSINYNTFTDRWLFLDSISWEKGKARDSILGKSYELPYDALQSFKSSPNYAIIMNNRFFRFNMKVKFILNSSPFQIGCAVADWRYGFSGYYDTVYNALQRNHVKLNAGSSNNAELFIPYHHFNSYLSNKSKECRIGKLTLRVLNSLSMSDSVSSACSISIYIAFEDIDTHGLISRSITEKEILYNGAQGQMNAIGSLCNEAGDVLDKIGKVSNVGSNMLRTAGDIFNQDKPPLPLQPMCLVPQTVQSFAYTDGIVEPINVLRSDPRGQRQPAVHTDEMDILKFMKGWGYVNTFSWKMTDPKGEMLYQLPVTPHISDYSNYGSAASTNVMGVLSVVLPPIGYISSFASKVRGNIEYRFEVIANSYYTGSLVISSIPLGKMLDQINYKEAMLSNTEIVDIQKTSIADISVPWNWYNAWMRTTNIHNEENYYATLNVYVLNQLIGIDSVPTSIDVNVYMRAGSNFEICQVKTPQIAIRTDVLVPPTNYILKPWNFECKWYTTNSSNVQVDGVYQWVVPYIGNVSNGWVGYTNVQAHTLYKLRDTLMNSTTQFRCSKSLGSGVVAYIEYGFYHEGLSTSNAHGLLVFTNKARAVEALSLIKKYGYTTKAAKMFFSKKENIAEAYVEDSAWSQISTDGGSTWREATNDSDSNFPVWEIVKLDITEQEQQKDTYPGADSISGQMDTNGIVINTEIVAPKTNLGISTYGEAMPDLKSIARRWQHYASFVGDTCQEKHPRDCRFLCKFPVRPWRTLNPKVSSNYDNRLRDGSIGLINKMFAYWEGGMRYRIIATHDIPDDSTIYITHRFDDESNVSNDILPDQDSQLTGRSFMDTHYPTFVQSLNVNSISTIEVPYMRSQERLATYEDALVPNSNGYVYIWVHSPKIATINLEIYYAVADDFQWSVFNGVPRSINVNTIPPEPAPQMNIEGKSSGIFEGFKKKMKPDALDRIETLSDTIQRSTEEVTSVAQSVDCSVKTMVGTVDEAASSFNKLSDKICSVIDSLKKIKMPTWLDPKESDEIKVSGILSGLLESSFDFITHIVYCLLSPTKLVIGWALLNLYKKIFGFSLEGLSCLKEYIGNLWDRATQSTQQPQIEQQMEDTDISSICSLLYCSLCSIVNLKVKPPNSWSNISEGLFRFSQYAKGGAFVGHFFKDNIELFKRIWRKVLVLFGVKSDNFKIVAGVKDNRLKSWLIHSTAILAPTVRDTVLTNHLWAEQVFALSIVGRSLSLAVIDESGASVHLRNLVTSTLRDLKKLEQELVNRNVFCGERYEPFCLWIAGAAGSGKTRYLQHIADELATAQNSSSVHTYHTISINQKYFDGFVGQPSILIDDFLSVSPLQDETVNQFVQMKSSALFNPPYSETHDKSRLVNFHNLLISSNFLSLTNQPGIHDKDAYNRRRDLVLSFELIDSKKLAKVYSIEECKKLCHVRVYHHPNELNTIDKVEIKRVENEDYNITVDKFILNEAKNYHLRETSVFKDKVKNKIQRIENLASTTNNLSEYLDKVFDTFNFGKEDVLEKKKDDFNDYITKVKDNLFKAWKVPMTDNISPQNDNIPQTTSSGKLWLKDSLSPDKKKIAFKAIEPFSLAELETEFNNGDIVYYLNRSSYYLPELKEKKVCAHKLAREHMKLYHYEKDINLFVLDPVIFDELELDYTQLPVCFSPDCCVRVSQNEKSEWSFVLDDNCILKTTLEKKHFKEFYINKAVQDDLAITNKILKLDQVGKIFTILEGEDKPFSEYMDIPESWLAEWFIDAKRALVDISPTLENARLSLQIDRLQQKIRCKYINIGDDIFPKDNPKKGWVKSTWDSFIKLAKKIFLVLIELAGLISSIILFMGIGIGGYNYLTNSHVIDPLTYLSGKACENYEISRRKGNLHPSGDFKTMKIKPSLKERALALGSGQISTDSDDAILNLCKKNNYFDKSSDGRLNKIISNVFTMVGIKKISEEQSLNFTVRCIGLREFEFLCLKHYIDHFEENGVDEVAIVYRKNKGIVRFNLQDIQFSWTSAGYGVGTLPVCGQPFKNIVKFLPSERFDGNYPYSMYMVEVFTDDVKIFELDCKKIKYPIKIPKVLGQKPWTITQGFEYNWEGQGRCGSFLFAPSLASPLVAVHTSGIRDKCGFAELLLRETFIEDKIDVDFVIPQMDINERGFEPEGDCYIIGHLPPEKAVNIPLKTKIIPSEIHGVFPVETEPAPLTKLDERLIEPFDPFFEGVSKRCDKPKEFPVGILQAAYLDLRTLLLQCKPLRDPGILSVKEAIEGLEIKGYEPLEIKTSEGYPWVLERPKRESDKSWMFEFEEENGRRKLIKIYKKLNDVLEIKDKMRSECLVPLTYATACLKDARIVKEKINKPGSTRVFEMCPVDMTISQRQYYLDFYAAYQNARLNAEHTIGINPDGVEWTELANKLINFSPFILTADYSGYGPRLLKSVQFKSLLIETGWYEHWQEKNDLDENIRDQEFIRRYSFIWESLCHPVVAKNAVINFNTGMDSGNPATVIRNSICNSLYIRCIYLILSKKYAKQYSSLYWFSKFVLMFSNGDDLIISVKENIISWFNNKTLIQAFAEFNIKMTDALKSGGDIREYCSLEEATYLKRGFKKHPLREGQWLAPLEKRSIRDTANWIWRSMNNRLASLVNSEQCARLSYTQGPEFYKEITEKLINVWKDKQVVFKVPSWESLDIHVWEGLDGPIFSYI
ncbi:hypothetical protein [Wuhan coneheads virus 1]|uniref:hypothetical protein n=1 Tax=Wuhan coneheads virus 1 TaxID=1923695 RepID=UPI00090AE13B|nr:hypothetical protein [Wuhan coneheads virus 1]APG78425.1 hypothetical protein [Wuhan coneheads virus 1]APG78629.1 hypothetical protein [Wuhan coneheads virus 1]